MELRKTELQEAAPCDAPRDDLARFLRELRQLRTEAGLGHVELAARAHYPGDVIRAAEAGPSLPSLPVLSAYVRGCGGTPAEWEERWRSLTRSPALPLLPFRSVGDSDAATAGARVGAATPAADAHDPGIIMAALSRVADSIAADSSSAGAFEGAGMADVLMSVPDTVEADGLDTVPPALSGADRGARWSPDTEPRDLPAVAAALDASAGSDTAPGGAAGAAATAGGRPSGAVAAPVANSGRSLPPRALPPRALPPRPVIAAVIVVVCLVAIMLALFA